MRFRTALCALVLGQASAQTYPGNLSAGHASIRYFDVVSNDPVARLQQKLERGKATLDQQDDVFGALPSLLQLLDVRQDSQMLVFTKTSFQSPRIFPRNPRAIFFNDEVTVGWVRGGLIELAAIDPNIGAVFYLFEDNKLTRREDCLVCHQGPATLGVPGLFVGSSHPFADGKIGRQGAVVTDHRTKFEERWGGWYVTGTHGEQRHRGNAIIPDPAQPEAFETEMTQNLTTLNRKFDAPAYLQPTSDIVALMTLEHQTQMTNMLTRLNWLHRMDANDTRIDSGVEELAAYMLFTDEAPINGPIKGVSAFTKTFADRGPRDAKGRSLRDFDLEKRLFRYPLSYLVYSPQFDALPAALRDRVYRRLFAKLTVQRKEIVEILRETKPGLPDYWRN